ncbi:glycosyltransferase family 2 protein [Rubinisphaera italica]|uniref:Undecaprenyl-phosphate 4-deoxy-4-formamido-L-arabinose transferase n=2 Tax=Rubinisphaera TaxID=1649490 RepID=A0A5C5XMP3_9PLAN|nr:glycosyltransferase family 2 protein [Rubinisphaera italica]TWT64220.1 Undecaprenyl-phosphate 4-deoxy-4-formamido-L-arabinose transferase [Rubinisphaera italica]
MLSIIVPVFNEEESLAELRSQISASCTASQIEYEVIFIDDGSSDSSWSIIEKLAGDHPEISGIRFRRNFGKAAALTAGMEAARGEWLMMMDADLQDDPAEIPKFLDKAAEGFDVVNGWKERRLDPWHKVYPSRVFNGMIGKLTGLKLHDHNCGLKLFHSDVAKEIHIYGELHRFIPVLAYSRGFRVTELVVNHRPRQFGHSKYGVIRFLRGFLDLLTVVFLIGYGQRPQHMLGAIGLFFFALGILGFGYLTLIWVLMNIFEAIPITPIGTRPLLAYSTAATILGAQAMSLGLLAELIVANTVHHRATFSVRERVGENTSIDL